MKRYLTDTGGWTADPKLSRWLAERDVDEALQRQRTLQVADVRAERAIVLSLNRPSAIYWVIVTEGEQR